jgi:hypothetical protein
MQFFTKNVLSLNMALTLAVSPTDFTFCGEKVFAVIITKGLLG